MRAVFEAKPPYNTYWLRFTVNPGDEVVNRLGGIGWRRGNDPFQVTLQKLGSGVFCGWTAQEKQQNLEETQRMLHELGIVYEIRHLKAQDLL